MSRVIDIYNFLDRIAPFCKQEEWDNSGLLIGKSDKTIKKALVALDSTSQLIDEAVCNGCELIITHHPIIFTAQRSLVDNSIPLKAAQSGVSVISAHTSFDCANGGVSDILAETIGLQGIKKSPTGEFTLGECEMTDVISLAKKIKGIFSNDVAFCNAQKAVHTVAVCGGAGSDFIGSAKQLGADAYVTGEVRHHDFLDAVEMDIGIITVGHFETEIIAMKSLKRMLEKEFEDVEFVFSQQTSPIKHI